MNPSREQRLSKRIPVRLVRNAPPVPLEYSTPAAKRGADLRVVARTLLWSAAIGILAMTVGAFALLNLVARFAPSSGDELAILVPLGQVFFGPTALIALGITLAHQRRLRRLLRDWEVVAIAACFALAFLPFPMVLLLVWGR